MEAKRGTFQPKVESGKPYNRMTMEMKNEEQNLIKFNFEGKEYLMDWDGYEIMQAMYNAGPFRSNSRNLKLNYNERDETPRNR